MRVIAILNSTAGWLGEAEDGRAAQQIAAAFGENGLAAEVRVVAGPDLQQAAQEAAIEADIVVLGGGDGTLSSGAAALADTGKPLGILPLGTLNHFARDLDIPLDLAEAVRTIRDGRVREVDVGEVNGRVFVNNCSIGVYPDLVRDRETQESKDDSPRWRAMLRAAWRALRRFRVRTVVLATDGRAWRVTTPLVFVGNNRYEIELPALGRRERLDGGELSVFLARNVGRWGLVKLCLRALAGGLAQARDFESLSVPDLELRTRRRRVRLAVDGEVVSMASPVRWRIRPRALRVIVPADTA